METYIIQCHMYTSNAILSLVAVCWMECSVLRGQRRPPRDCQATGVSWGQHTPQRSGAEDAAWNRRTNHSSLLPLVSIIIQSICRLHSKYCMTFELTLILVFM